MNDINIKMTRDQLISIITSRCLSKVDYFSVNIDKVMKFESIMRDYINGLKEDQKDLNVILDVADQIAKDLN